MILKFKFGNIYPLSGVCVLVSIYVSNVQGIMKNSS